MTSFYSSENVIAIYIRGIRIQNYKSFNSVEEIILDQRINIVTGKNNAGKSAFLECLELDFGVNPHRSLSKNKRSRSVVILNINVSVSDINRWLNLTPQSEYTLHIPKSAFRQDQNIADNFLRNGSIAIAGVKSTADFEKKNVRHTFEIYEKLTHSTALVPPAVGYIFDREGRSDTELSAIKSHMDDRVFFLERRCYENYLLHSGAIHHVLSRTVTFQNVPPAAQNASEKKEFNIKAIEDWIGGNSSKYAKGIDFIANRKEWICKVDAPKLLKELFEYFTENRESYNKTVYSVAMTEWLLSNHPNELEEVANLILKSIKTS